MGLSQNRKNNMEILAHKSALNSSNISKEKQTKKVLIKVHKLVPKKVLCPKIVLQIVLILVMTF